ncbi:MAG: hypothetical protein KA313_07615 [Pseudarcicella sp.]|jgi:thiosulfate reductase cytochrome b subunit|nr:hypothetical protein [Pseudarcicella sp.]MBP6410947.1 hypothetical protein [Pseudarcicella sp.]
MKKYNQILILQWLLFLPLILPLSIITGIIQGIKQSLAIMIEQIKMDITSEPVIREDSQDAYL